MTPPTLIPYLTVRNAREAMHFYEKAFGFRVINTQPMQDDPETLQHAEMGYRDIQIMFAPEGAYGATSKAPNTLGVEASLTLYIYCDDVDVFYKKAIDAGAVAAMEPHDSFWGDRVCQLTDPDGFKWMFATPLER